MMVIIMGEDRAEYCKVKKKHKEKHFFKTRNQLYRVRPEGLARCRIDYFGTVETDEIIVYSENEIIPYQPKGEVQYTMDKMYMDLDAHKQMTGGSWFGKRTKQWFSGQQGKDLMKYVKDPSVWGILLAIIVAGPIILGMVFK